MSKNFPDHFGENDLKKLKALSGPWIRELRNRHGLTAPEMQLAVNQRAGIASLGSAAKQSNWELGKSLPDENMQRAMLEMDRQIQGVKINRIKLDFEPPAWFALLRELIYRGDFEVVRVWGIREYNNGPLIREQEHPDVWPLLLIYLALMARFENNEELALEFAEEADGFGTENTQLDLVIKETIIGYRFEGAVANEKLSESERLEIFRELYTLQKEILRKDQKRYRWHKNALRIESRLGMEEAFDERFEYLKSVLDHEEITAMLNNDADGDFLNARRFGSIKNFQKGVVNIALITLVSIASFFGLGLAAHDANASSTPETVLTYSTLADTTHDLTKPYLIDIEKVKSTSYSQLTVGRGKDLTKLSTSQETEDADSWNSIKLAASQMSVIAPKTGSSTITNNLENSISIGPSTYWLDSGVANISQSADNNVESVSKSGSSAMMALTQKGWDYDAKAGYGQLDLFTANTAAKGWDYDARTDGNYLSITPYTVQSIDVSY